MFHESKNYRKEIIKEESSKDTGTNSVLTENYLKKKNLVTCAKGHVKLIFF